MPDQQCLTDKTNETMQFLANSPSRLRILKVLVSKPCTETELQEHLEIPQATLNQNLDKLEESNWIAMNGTHYRPTGRGYGYANALATHTATLSAVEKFAPLLEYVDPLLLDFRALADGSLHTPKPNDPFAAYNAVEKWITGSDSIQGFVPTFGPAMLERLRREIIGTADVEFVFEDTATETEIRRTDWAGFEQEQTSPEYYFHDGELPFVLVLLSEAVIIGGLDDNGLPRAFVVAENRAARDWAERMYENYRSGAEPLSRA